MFILLLSNGGKNKVAFIGILYAFASARTPDLGSEADVTSIARYSYHILLVQIHVGQDD